MNVFDGSLSDVDAEESQATQLIHAALEQSPEPSEDRIKGGVMVPNKDNSVESFPSSRNSATTSVHHYHFHGLAATQTQTQLCDDEDSANSGMVLSEGSQKENLGTTGTTGRDIKWGMPSPDSRPSSPHGLAVKDNVTMDRRPGTPGRATKKPKPPTVAFQSPTKNPILPSTTHKMDSQPTKAKGKLDLLQPSRQKGSRSRSPILSQDSFAQVDSQLSEDKFLVTSKKFTTPLADLARAAEDEYSGVASRRMGVTQSSYSSSTTIPRQDDRPPVILVPSTPSQSESSDYSREESVQGIPPPLSQRNDSFEQAQGASRMTLDTDSGKGSQHSQGYDGQDEVAEVQDLYANTRDTSRGPTTRPIMHPEPPSLNGGFHGTQQATQVATQDDFVAATSSVVPQTNTSTHTGPRSLLSTMDPHKRGRYQHLVRYTPASPISPVPQQFPAGTARMTADGAETQLPGVAGRLRATSPQPAPLPLRPIPSPGKASPKKPAHRQPPAPCAVDAMDVVPDSEPMREQVQSSVEEEQRSMEVGTVIPEIQRGSVAAIPSHDGETTEDSDVLPPKKTARREEEEEEEEEEAEREEQTEERRHEEDDDDDDDDVPLSARLRKDKGKALATATRGKAPDNARTYSSKTKTDRKATKPQPIAAVKRPDPPHQQRGRKGSNSHKPPVADISNESAIPSSVPDQDHARPARSRKPTLKAVVASKDKGKQPVRKPFRATSVARSARSYRSATVETEENPDVEMEEVSDSERATEPAMDDEEEYMEPESPQQNLKRKRGRPPKSKSLNQAAVTPRTRLTKRLKSAGSTISRADATRVFALWRQNGLWYSGIVYEHLSDDNYNVKFDDGFESAVIAGNMRINNLRVGDFVRINKKAKDYKVVRVNYRTNTVCVDIAGEEEELQIRDISISTKMINSGWQDRTVDNRLIVPAIREVETKPTPSPSRSAASFLSNAKGARPLYKFLHKVGLIVSLSRNNTNDKTKDGRSRSDILNAVRDSGGVVVDDLFKYLKMDISYSSERCVIEASDVKWVGEPKELERLFLLADDCNLKPKYLMALALGIPCLSVNWLYSCLEVGKELDWRPYLLPQGRPTLFDVLPSQQIDLNWGNQLGHLPNIMLNPVAPKILDGLSILCVGPDMTPKTNKAGEAANDIIRIILAMGAARVEAVRDISYALNPLSQYGFLIIREKDQYTSSYVQARTVDWNWVKDSLIMSRRLPYPSWPVEEDSQCSQSL